jgi:restriction system protein
LARRKRESNAEAVMDLVALLPWWAGVALAVGSWMLFHSIAGSTPPKITSAGQLGSGFFLGIWLRGISTALQIIAPVFCLAGALASYLRRQQRTGLVLKVTASNAAETLNDMSWREFELLVGEAFRLQGYDVQEQGGARPDGGVDLIARKGTETFLVQCKQWRALKVGVDVVRELYGVMAARGAAGGFVVTSGKFTDDAIAFANGRNVRLVEGSKLFGMLQQAKTSLAGRAQPLDARASANAGVTATGVVEPSCPVCSASMVRRTATKGTNAGSQFWGCSTFPVCRGTR